MAYVEDSKIERLQKGIFTARQEARRLYSKLEHVREETQNTTLSKVSKDIPSLPKNYCNLKLYNTLRGHLNKVSKIAWGNDSTTLLSACQDGYMILWDSVTGLKKQAITLENQWVLTCSLSPNGNLTASGGLDNACTIYKIKPDIYDDVTDERGYEMATNFFQSTETVLKGHTAYISDCEFLTNNILITASGDMTCAMWDVQKVRKVRDFVDHLGDVLCLSKFPQISNTGPLFLSGSCDAYVKVWDTRAKSSVQNFFISHSDINTIKTFPEGYNFITGSDDGIIRMFDLRSDCQLECFSLDSQFTSLQHSTSIIPNIPFLNSNHKNYKKAEQIYKSIDNPGILSVDFSLSGRLIYSCYSDFGCVIWDTLKNDVVGSIGNEHVNKISQVSISPDGMGVATSSWDSTIKIWSV